MSGLKIALRPRGSRYVGYESRPDPEGTDPEGSAEGTVTLKVLLKVLKVKVLKVDLTLKVLHGYLELEFTILNGICQAIYFDCGIYRPERRFKPTLDSS